MKTNYFPKYNQLKWYEKILLNTCCYFPPKPRRKRGVEIEIDLEEYLNKFLRAYCLKNLNALSGKHILDFGCGEGGFSLALADQLKESKVTGIDLLKAQGKANQIAKNKGIKNLEFRIGSSEHLKNNSFDIVFSHDSFEHFEDPRYILSEMIRLTKIDGVILIKFGPTWASPYGRHMGGTYKKNWPWIHLLIPEKQMMRVHSVYHNRKALYEQYKDLEGGLNQMTVRKAMKVIGSFNNIEIVEKKVNYVWKGKIFSWVPLLKELFSGSFYIQLKKIN